MTKLYQITIGTVTPATETAPESHSTQTKTVTGTDVSDVINKIGALKENEYIDSVEKIRNIDIV